MKINSRSIKKALLEIQKGDIVNNKRLLKDTISDFVQIFETRGLLNTTIKDFLDFQNELTHIAKEVSIDYLRIQPIVLDGFYIDAEDTNELQKVESIIEEYNL